MHIIFYFTKQQPRMMTFPLLLLILYLPWLQFTVTNMDLKTVKLQKLFNIELEVNMAAESSRNVLEIPKELLTLRSTIDNQSVCKPLWTFAKQANGYSLKLFWSSILYLQLVPALSQLEKESVTGREWMHFFQRSDYNQSLSCSQLLVNWVPLNFLVFMHVVWTPNQIS